MKDSKELLKDLPTQYKFKGITVNVEREFKSDGKNYINCLIEMIERKKIVKRGSNYARSKKERVEVETYYVDDIKVKVERIFIKSGVKYIGWPHKKTCQNNRSSYCSRKENCNCTHDKKMII